LLGVSGKEPLMDALKDAKYILNNFQVSFLKEILSKNMKK